MEEGLSIVTARKDVRRRSDGRGETPVHPILCTESAEGDPPPPQRKQDKTEQNSARLQGTNYIDATEIGCLSVHSQQTIRKRKEEDDPMDSEGNNAKKIPRSPSNPRNKMRNSENGTRAILMKENEDDTHPT